LSTRQIFELILLAALWGSSFMFMRIGAPEFGPFAFMAVRTAIAALVLFPIVYFSAKAGLILKHKKALFIIGMANTAVPFVLFGYAALTLTAGMTSVLNATTPMFAALVAFIWLREKLSVIAIIGLLIGFSGVLVLSANNGGFAFNDNLLAVFAVLAATCCYGIAASYTKQFLTGVSSVVITAGSQLWAAIILLPFGIYFWPQNLPSVDAWTAVSLLAIACTSFALILYFRLIANIGPAKAVSVTYLIPVFGIIWGVIFLNETVNSQMLIGACLILLGVSFTTGLFKRIRQQKAA
jgi:drug/metabolite transporter (DMT)-like permease